MHESAVITIPHKHVANSTDPMFCWSSTVHQNLKKKKKDKIHTGSNNNLITLNS